jgi:ELWxxDGT repeat protein
VDGTLFFLASQSTTGIELWASDGTTKGTRLVADINPGPAPAFTYDSPWLTEWNGLAAFIAEDGTHGFELWVSDGTSAGTRMVKDIRPGAGHAFPPEQFPFVSLFNMGGTLYFGADDGANGMELWRSDGTADGTVLAADINPGAAPSYPYWLREVNGALVFAAQEPTYGRELWRYEAMLPGPPVGPPGWLNLRSPPLGLHGPSEQTGTPQPLQSRGRADGRTAHVRVTRESREASTLARASEQRPREIELDTLLEECLDGIATLPAAGPRY